MGQLPAHRPHGGSYSVFLPSSFLNRELFLEFVVDLLFLVLFSLLAHLFRLLSGCLFLFAFLW